MLKSIRSTRNQTGFTLIELLIIIVVIGVLAAVAVPRFMGAQNRARIGAARSDLDLFRQGLGMYEIDNSDYPAALTLATASTVLVDPQGNPYMSLPTGENFTSFTYTYDGASNPTLYEILVICKDNAGTELKATPEGIQ